MLNRHNLAIAKLAATKESRYTLCGVWVTPEATIETDGHQLLRVTRPDVSEAFPVVEGFTPEADHAPFLLPTKQALQIEKAISNKKRDPIATKRAAVEHNGLGPRIAVSHLGNGDQVFQVEHRAGLIFPDYKRVLNQPGKVVLTVGFNAELLGKVLTEIARFTDDKNKRVKMVFRGDDTAVILESKNSDGQLCEGAVMPLRL